MRSTRAVLAAAALLLALPAAGAGQSATYSARADLVVLHAMVTDGRGAPVGGLKPQLFRVFEDGRPQDIAFFLESDSPVSIGLLIDSSGSMLENRDKVIAAAGAFLDTRRPLDETFALAFNDDVRPVLPPGMPFTSDPGVMRHALARQIGARGRTALYDAVVAGLEHLARGSHYRKALIIVGDGGDNASRTTFDEVLSKARAADTLIYAIALSDRVSPSAGNPKTLRRLAEATGGLAIAPRRATAVASGFARISEDIRSVYTLAYAPARVTGDGRFRHTRVTVDAAAAGRRLHVRARPGYVVPAAQGASP